MNDPTEQVYERLLVVRCQAGDHDAFRELFQRFHPRLSYFVHKLLPRGHRNDDVLQEIWIDVYRQLARLQDAGAFIPWVYRIARGRVNLEYRRNGRSQPISAPPDVEPTTADEPQFSSENAAEIHKALDQLPPEQREVLVLRFLESMTYDEIGQITGCPLGTVRSRIHYAKLALKKFLAEEGV